MGEESWDPSIPRSKGTINLAATINLGKCVLTDGPRVIVCADCGTPVTDGMVWHMKPELYEMTYGGETFYLERHIGIKCGCAKKRGLVE